MKSKLFLYKNDVEFAHKINFFTQKKKILIFDWKAFHFGTELILDQLKLIQSLLDNVVYS
jgi:hypothetical protein